MQKGDNKILLSPASVDIGWRVHHPREEDFRKITAADINDILRRCASAEDETDNLNSRLL
ncbi:MAG: DUF4922 domain-containing protein [Marinilabiliales bacterium]|nr:DUF4922 domain-containing protein [Marinilabiliales bacterium]